MSNKLAYATYTPAADQQQVLSKRDQGHHLVTVRVEMPHLARYNRPTTMTLVYGAKFDARIGQSVMVPPTRLSQRWTRGTVVALDERSSWTGPLKYVVPARKNSKRG